MTIVPDTEYNDKYPERPRRFIASEDGAVSPTYFTEDVIPTSVARAQTDLDRWNEIDGIVAAL